MDEMREGKSLLQTANRWTKWYNLGKFVNNGFTGQLS